MTNLHLTEPWWYYALFTLAAAAVILEFWFIRWAKDVKTRRLARRIAVLDHDPDTYLANLCWTHLRQYEAILAHRLGMQRLIREHPERVAALLGQAPTLQIVGDDWAAL